MHKHDSRWSHSADGAVDGGRRHRLGGDLASFANLEIGNLSAGDVVDPACETKSAARKKVISSG